MNFNARGIRLKMLWFAYKTYKDNLMRWHDYLIMSVWKGEREL